MKSMGLRDKLRNLPVGRSTTTTKYTRIGAYYAARETLGRGRFRLEAVRDGQFKITRIA